MPLRRCDREHVPRARRRLPCDRWVTQAAVRDSSRGPPTTRASASVPCDHEMPRRATPETCLAAVRPEIAAQWHPALNGQLTPSDVTVSSNRKVWWRCEQGHEWEAQVIARGRGVCPFCSGRRVTADNSLARLRPDIAAQWHPTRNGALTPAAVTSRSSKKVWWRCENNHEWEAPIGVRARTGCPFCSGRRASPETCLAALRPRSLANGIPPGMGS